MITMDQVEDWASILTMWMRRVRGHNMLEVAVTKFQLDLARLDKELRAVSGDGPTFDEDMDRVLRERVAAIESGKTSR